MSNLFANNRLDSGVNTFSPEGRLFQVEYALEAIKLGATAIGIQTQHGVLLAVEKRAESAKLMVPESNTKIFEVDSHVGAVYSGLQADGKTLVDNSRVQSQSYWFTYDEAIPVRSLAQSLADAMMSFAGTDDDDEDRPKMSRPYGCAILMAGVDDTKGPQLYVVDPSGTMVQYLATAVGAGGESARSTLQDKYHRSMSVAEAEDLGAEILKQVMEADIAPDTFEMAFIAMDPSTKFKYSVYSKPKLQTILDRLTTSEDEEAVEAAQSSAA